MGLIRPLPLRLTASLFLIVIAAVGISLFWHPVTRVRDGRHDLRRNAIWMGHGWLGADAWFKQYQKDEMQFRNDQRIAALRDRLTNHGVKYVYPHLCPCSPDGSIAAVDDAQTERFLNILSDIQVIPWVGGVFGEHCFPDSPDWRRNFVASITDLLTSHPRLAGIQLNIEPLPNGNANFLLLLDELRAALPTGKTLAVAAYPPPTKWHPFPDIHWDETYHREVAQRVDQMASMMYDTALQSPRKYDKLMAQWTREVLEWSEGTEVLLGIPVYADEGVGYHYPAAENLKHGLSGIQRGLKTFDTLPTNYAGIAIYCEWEMDHAEWEYLQHEFGKPQHR